jgi:hypothetical protein
VRSPLRFKNVTLSLAGPAVSFERVPSDREILKPLFVVQSGSQGTFVSGLAGEEVLGIGGAGELLAQ